MRSKLKADLNIPINGINIYDRINATLVAHVYAEAEFGLAASLFCALVVFAGLYSHFTSNTRLFIWMGFYLIVISARFLIVRLYKRDPFLHRQYALWNKLYTLGAALGGLSWGLATILMPIATPIERVLIVLMLAGVTAGSVPLTVGMPRASILFLVFSLVPFIVYFVSSLNSIFLLFASALTLYLIYSIVLTIKSTQTITQAIELQYENAALLQNLSEAKYQLELTNEKLEYAATHDPLTHVANRNLFQVNLDKSIYEAAAKRTMFALIYLDLDRFKQINDEYGHHVGDSVLVIITNRLIHFFHVNEDIARLGGEEFAILVKNVKSINKVERMADQLCHVLAEPMQIQGVGKLKVTVSIGLSIFPHDGINSEVLLSHADKTMYAIKQTGGNDYYHVSQELHH